MILLFLITMKWSFTLFHQVYFLRNKIATVVLDQVLCYFLANASKIQSHQLTVNELNDDMINLSIEWIKTRESSSLTL